MTAARPGSSPMVSGSSTSVAAAGRLCRFPAGHRAPAAEPAPGLAVAPVRVALSGGACHGLAVVIAGGAELASDPPALYLEADGLRRRVWAMAWKAETADSGTTLLVAIYRTGRRLLHTLSVRPGVCLLVEGRGRVTLGEGDRALLRRFAGAKIAT